MPGAIIVADQTRPGPSVSYGTPGVARNDLWVGWLIQLHDGAGGNGQWEWTLLAAPAGSAAQLTGEDTATPTFTPDLPGTYRLQLITNSGGPGNLQILVFRVRYDVAGVLAYRGWALPGFGEQDGESNYNNNAIAWAEPLEFIFADINETLTNAETTLTSAETTLASVVSMLADVLPVPGISDVGKVLKATGTGVASWQAAGGGGGGPLTDELHGERGGGALHALATNTVAGFMSAVHRTFVETLRTGDANLVVNSLSSGSGLSTGSTFITATSPDPDQVPLGRYDARMTPEGWEYASTDGRIRQTAQRFVFEDSGDAPFQAYDGAAVMANGSIGGTVLLPPLDDGLIKTVFVIERTGAPSTVTANGLDLFMGSGADVPGPLTLPGYAAWLLIGLPLGLWVKIPAVPA